MDIKGLLTGLIWIAFVSLIVMGMFAYSDTVITDTETRSPLFIQDGNNVLDSTDNTTMTTYVDGQDTIYNASTKTYADAQDEVYNDSIYSDTYVMKQGGTWTDSQNASSNSLTDLSFWSIVSGATKVKVNTTGLWIDGGDGYEKVTFGSEDVTVCRSTGAVDLIVKTFTCDVVCSDSDCSDELTLSDGEVAYIKGGIYPLTSTFVVTDKDVKYIGENKETVIFRMDSTNINMINITNSDVHIENINWDGNSLARSLVYVISGNITLRSNIFEKYAYGIGVHLYGGTAIAIVRDNIFRSPRGSGDLMAYTITDSGFITGNLFDRRDESVAGALLTSGAAYRVHISDNTFLKDGAAQRWGISLENDYGTHFQDVVISDNILNNTDIRLGKSSADGNMDNIKISNNLLSYGGIEIVKTGTSVMKDIMVTDNQITNAWYGGITATNINRIEVNGNRIYNANMQNNTDSYNKGGIYFDNVNNSEILNNVITMDADGTYVNPFGIKTNNIENVSIEGNFVHSIVGHTSYLFAGTVTDSYIDVYEYTSMSTCANGNLFDRRYITNSSDYHCRCDSGTWKCLGPYV